ncbi:MAG: PEP-CTERM sorting domain-containing protein [Gemmataceae bacterium]
MKYQGRFIRGMCGIALCWLLVGTTPAWAVLPSLPHPIPNVPPPVFQQPPRTDTLPPPALQQPPPPLTEDPPGCECTCESPELPPPAFEVPGAPSDDGDVCELPEPASLITGLIGASLAGWYGRRRRRTSA